MSTGGVSLPVTDPSLSISDFFDSVLGKLKEDGAKLKEQIDAVMNGDELSPEMMMAIQYLLSMYNTLIEMSSALIQSLTSTAKNVAQRIG